MNHQKDRSRKSRKRKKQAPRVQSAPRYQAGFRVEAYNGDIIDTYITTREKALALDLKSYDCCLAPCLGVYGFRQPGTGKWIDLGDNGHTIGPVQRDILENIQNSPGVHLDHFSLYMLTGREELSDGANVAAGVCRMRRAFHEDKNCEHFILTDNGVAWRRQATWIRVELTLKARSDSEADTSQFDEKTTAS